MTLAFLPNFNGFELLIIAGIALLLFGRRLPEVGKSLGKGIVEFKKGLSGIEDEVNNASKPSVQTLPAQPVYRAPVVDGEDRRVSRADAVVTEASRPDPAP